MPAGRPTEFKKEYCAQAEKLCKLGATDADLADFFDVNTSTIWRWSSRYHEFCKALKCGKESADSRVERSLYQRAIGYEFDSEKIFQYEGSVVRAPVREKVNPDTVACIFWLKNRRPDLWRDKLEHVTTGNVTHTHVVTSELPFDAIRSRTEEKPEPTTTH